ncbi:hypothetical protein J6590_029523 [Homalodisca vitripennis]|nr:hypothetical protein J6590_082814 [Homalodisca vitripennis]KAG8337171.1 hypothetical protein J6590_029523 [Homalodisca vitripennis]
MHCPFCKKWIQRQNKTTTCPSCTKKLLRCDECLTITADTFNFCIKCGHNLSRIIRINRAKEQKNQVKQQLLSKPKFVSTMLSSSSSEGITFSELNLTGEELKYLDEIEENQEHNIGNILAVPNLSESPRPPATPSISLDEIGESQEHISNILAVATVPRGQVLASKVKTSLAAGFINNIN